MKKFSKIVLSFLLTMSLTVGLKVNNAEAVVNPNINSNVVFYIPHQDDESLNFGVGIINHLKTGHNVHVVLLTDGSASIVKSKLGMTDTQFTNARNREFAWALAIMGVKSSNITYENLKDGAVEVSQVESIIRKYETKYPNAKHKAYSPSDWHNDHKNSGQALKNLQKAGVVSDARFYVRYGDYPVGYVLIRESYPSEYKNIFLAVSTAYNIENDILGLYGIGHKSAKDLFTNFESQPLSRYHK